MQEKRACVYTGLFGNYEKLNEQSVRKESDIDFLCFSDDKELVSDTWKIVPVDPVFPLDPIRSARTIKIAAHRYLPQYEASLYIDNSVTLQVPPEIIFEELLPDDASLCCVKHSFRKTLFDEFEEVVRLDYDKLGVIMEQFNAYNIIDPNMFSEKPYWSGFLLRYHNQLPVKNMMEDWLAQVLRYSRRDQLSLNYAIRKHGINVKKLQFDNNTSDYHKWPSAVRYKSAKINRSLTNALDSCLRVETLKNQILNIAEDFDELETRLAETESMYQNLKNQIAERGKTIQGLNTQLAKREQEVLSYALSKSWRFTRLFRKTMKVLGRKNNA